MIQALFWLGAMIVLFVVEAATVSLISVWFALGCLGAIVAALCHAPLWVQALVFLVIGIVLLVFTRPLVRKYVNSKRTATNADRVIGQMGKVTELIDNIAGTGAVHVLGKEWTARSLNGARIGPGTVVGVARLEGVKLWVEPATVVPDVPAPPAEDAQPAESAVGSST